MYSWTFVHGFPTQTPGCKALGLYPQKRDIMLCSYMLPSNDHYALKKNHYAPMECC